MYVGQACAVDILHQIGQVILGIVRITDRMIIVCGDKGTVLLSPVLFMAIFLQSEKAAVSGTDR